MSQKTFNQFQQDVTGAASSLMTQLLCAERGINYDQLQQMAQQTHINGILQAEQQRQMNAVINRHYQGNSFVGKLRDLVGGQPSNFLIPQPMPTAQPIMQPQLGMPSPFGMPAAPVQQMFPQAGMNPYQTAQMIGHAPVQQVQQPQAPSSADVEMFKTFVSTLVSALAPQQLQAPVVQQQPVPSPHDVYMSQVPVYPTAPPAPTHAPAPPAPPATSDLVAGPDNF